MGKPVLVLRNTTERPEGVEAGTLKLAGTNEESIYLKTKELLDDIKEYERMSKAVNPYGDGTASKKIVDEIIRRMEKYEKRIHIARENFRRAGLEDRITLMPGDAMEVLKELDGPYDFIFMDAAKGQYISYLPEILRLLPRDGILVSDNVLQDGDVIESRFAVERRNRTIHARMREYLYELTHCGELRTSVLPLGDGITVSVRTQKEE